MFVVGLNINQLLMVAFKQTRIAEDILRNPYL
jgi:hypothetical protein